MNVGKLMGLTGIFLHGAVGGSMMVRCGQSNWFLGDGSLSEVLKMRTLLLALLLGIMGCSPMTYVEVANETDRQLQNVDLEGFVPGGVFAVGARFSAYTRRPTVNVFTLSWDGADGARRGVLIPRREVLPAGFNNDLVFLILSDDAVEVRSLSREEYTTMGMPPWPRAGRIYPAADVPAVAK